MFKNPKISKTQKVVLSCAKIKWVHDDHYGDIPWTDWDSIDQCF